MSAPSPTSPAQHFRLAPATQRSFLLPQSLHILLGTTISPCLLFLLDQNFLIPAILSTPKFLIRTTACSGPWSLGTVHSASVPSAPSVFLAYSSLQSHPRILRRICESPNYPPRLPTLSPYTQKSGCLPQPFNSVPCSTLHLLLLILRLHLRPFCIMFHSASTIGFPCSLPRIHVSFIRYNALVIEIRYECLCRCFCSF